MDFFKALNVAKEQGLTLEQFVPIWQAEINLQQSKEDLRLLETKQQISEVRIKFKSPSFLPCFVQSQA